MSEHSTSPERTPSPPRKVSPWIAGLFQRCPRCGEGKLMHQGLAIRESCTVCGLDFKFLDIGDGPAVFAILILGFVVLGGALYVEFKYEPGVYVHAALWGLLTPILALGLLRVLKGILAALQYANDAEQGRLAKDQDNQAG